MKITVTSPSFSQNKTLQNILTNTISAEFKFNTEGIRFNQNELIDFVGDSEALIIGLEKINEEVLTKLPKLKYIAKYGVGLDNIDLEACKRHNVKIGWKGGVNRLSVAEMTIGFMLTLVKNMYQSSLLLHKSEWKKNGGQQLTEKTIGLIGFGHIGQEVARLLAPFNCKILSYDILDKSIEAKKLNVKLSSVEEIISESDIISFHVPFMDSTKYYFNQSFLNNLKKCPIVINTSRGGIVDENVMIEALKKNKVLAYGVDVFEEEPCHNVNLLAFNNVFCTPHIGGNTSEAVMLMGESAVNQLREIING